MATVDAPDSADAVLNIVRSANGGDVGTAAKASMDGQAV
jgi:hypothetical protein